MDATRDRSRQAARDGIGRPSYCGIEDTSAVKMSPQLQHRLRGALNAAGFKSTGSKFTSGDHKGRTIFALASPEPKLPL